MGISKTVFVCHESLAQAQNELGFMFEKVVKLENVANTLYLSVIQHAEIASQASGANYFTRPWYQQAKIGIEERRKRNLAYDSAEMQKIRAPTLTKLQPQLEAIKACLAKFESKQYKAHGLLVFLRDTHPPKGKDATKDKLEIDRDDKKVVTKLLKQSVITYHPDKQHNKDAGIEWLVLCEEISKILNELYGHFKGVDT